MTKPEPCWTLRSNVNNNVATAWLQDVWCHGCPKCSPKLKQPHPWMKGSTGIWLSHVCRIHLHRPMCMATLCSYVHGIKCVWRPMCGIRRVASNVWAPSLYTCVWHQTCMASNVYGTKCVGIKCGLGLVIQMPIGTNPVIMFRSHSSLTAALDGQAEYPSHHNVTIVFGKTSVVNT